MDDDFQDLGETWRQKLGIDGSMGDAQDEPRPYISASLTNEGACAVCGLAEPDEAAVEAWHNWFGRLSRRMAREAIHETLLKQASIELATAGVEVPTDE